MKNNKNIDYLKKMILKNHKTLNCIYRKPRKNIVNLHWWSMRRNDHVENVGDYLSVVICNYMLRKRGKDLYSKTNKTKHLYAVGSIIQGGAQNATIWGSGLKSGSCDLPILLRKTRKLDIRCVRGPETEKALHDAGFDCPKKYGDPALLMPLLYTPRSLEKTKYKVVLHHATRNIVDDYLSPITGDYKGFIDELVNTELVISSSLHGVILAEAYGVPAILLADKSTDNTFKYKDYYGSTGRRNFPIAKTIEEALKMKPSIPKNIEQLQKNLLETFPYDLWEERNV